MEMCAVVGRTVRLNSIARVLTAEEEFRKEVARRVKRKGQPKAKC